MRLVQEEAVNKPNAGVDWSFMRPWLINLEQALGNRVLSGPFAGMEVTLQPAWADGATSAKLYGNYETELHEHVLAAVARKPKVVVNVGCAEGYYAIGLARLLPEATVYAIDVDKKSLALCEEYAKKNGVFERMFFRYGNEDPASLDFNIGDGHRLYFMDCEGAEFKLLDPEKCPALKHADLIVEYHDFKNKGLCSGLMQAFSSTHAIVHIIPVKDAPLLFQIVCHWPGLQHVLRVSDARFDGNAWVVLWAKDYHG